MVNAKFILLTTALAFLLTTGVTVFYTAKDGSTQTRTFQLPSQVQFHLKQIASNVECVFQWDTKHSHFRYECTRAAQEDGSVDPMNQFTLITDLGSDGSAVESKSYQWDALNWRITTNNEIPDYDQGLYLAHSMADDCKESPNSGGPLPNIKLVFAEECASGQLSWLVSSQDMDLYLTSNNAADTITHFGSESCVVTEGFEVESMTEMAWAADDVIFRTPGGCDGSVDMGEVTDDISLFKTGETGPITYEMAARPFPIPLAEIQAKKKAGRALLYDEDSWFNAIYPGTQWCGKGNKCGNCRHNCPDPATVTLDTNCCATNTAFDAKCRQHDQCPFGWGSKSACKCDQVMNNQLGSGSGQGVAKLLFGGQSPLLGCYNWQSECTSCGWCGCWLCCQGTSMVWHKRVGIPLLFNKYSGGTTMSSGSVPAITHYTCNGPTPAPPPPTPAPTYASWVPYSTTYSDLAYRLTGGVCQLRGMIKNGSPNFVGQLPSYCRPKKKAIFTCRTAGGNARCDVDTAGIIRINTAVGSTSWVSLAQIMFTAANYHNQKTAITYSGPWSDYNAAQGSSMWEEGAYRVMGGVCTLEGLAWRGGSSPSNYNVITNLPSNCRPSKRLIFNANSHKNVARVDVLVDGKVIFRSGLTTYGWVSMSGISFVTANSVGFSQGVLTTQHYYNTPTSLGGGGNINPLWAMYDPSGNTWGAKIDWHVDNYRCYVTGLVKNTNSAGLVNSAVNNIITILPECCRPRGGRAIFNLNYGSGYNRIDVETNGNVRFMGGNTQSGGWVSLTGISFHTSASYAFCIEPIEALEEREDEMKYVPNFTPAPTYRRTDWYQPSDVIIRK